jgi:Fe-S-cluster containining protein
VFDVHAADARLLGAWLAGAPEPERAAVLRRARDVVASVQRSARRLALTDESIRGWHWREGLATLSQAVASRLAEEAATACPLLDPTGSCRAHAFRPALCRLQGVPWQDPVTGAALPDFCRLEPGQESMGDQPADLLRLDEFRESSRMALAATTGRTFVAAALLLEEGQGPPLSLEAGAEPVACWPHLGKYPPRERANGQGRGNPGGGSHLREAW